MSELMAASHQWASRPADQRFGSLREMYLEAFAESDESIDRMVNINRLDPTITPGGDIQLATPHDGNLNFTNWSFAQLCRTIGAPVDFLKTHSDNPDLVQRNIRAALAKTAAGPDFKSKPNLQLYINQGANEARAVTKKYARVENYKIVKKLMDLPGNWMTPPAMATNPDSPTARPATEEDCKVSTTIRPGDMIDNAGLYMGPEDLFVFLVNPDRRVKDGTNDGLSRGFFATNSEVGKKKFKLVTFLYRYTCGNHIVWGAEDVDVFSRKHVGDGAESDIFAGIETALEKYENLAASKEETLIVAAQNEIWSGFDDLSDDLLELGIAGFGKRKVQDAFALAEKYAGTDGSPRSPWGIANGITRLSQITPFADARTALDSAAGVVLNKFVKVG